MIDREMDLLSMRHQLDRTIAARDLAQRMRDEAMAECDRLKTAVAELKSDNAHLAERWNGAEQQYKEAKFVGEQLQLTVDKLGAELEGDSKKVSDLLNRLSAAGESLAEREMLTKRASEIEREALGIPYVCRVCGRSDVHEANCSVGRDVVYPPTITIPRAEHEALTEALLTLHDECCVTKYGRLNVGPMIEPSERAVLRARQILASIFAKYGKPARKEQGNG